MNRTEKQNPQDWLPVGQRVNVGAATSPHSYDDHGNSVIHKDGEIVQHLANGSVVVKFDHYFATWDYTAREARGFARTN